MSKTIPVEESFAVWRKDPKYVEAYDTLEDEFSLRGGADRDPRACRPDTAAARGSHAYDTGGHRAPGKRPGKALHPHPRTPRRGDRDAAAHLFEPAQLNKSASK